MFRPPPPGTKLTPWVPDLIFTPISRAFERLGVYFYNRVIHRTEIGLFDKRWNPKVHGPYCHWRYYGKPDTKLMNVKVAELPAWIGRREKTIGAFYNEFMRQIWRVHNKFYSGPVYAPVVKTIFRFIFAFSFLNWFVKQHRYWEIKKNLILKPLRCFFELQNQRTNSRPGKFSFFGVTSQRSIAAPDVEGWSEVIWRKRRVYMEQRQVRPQFANNIYGNEAPISKVDVQLSSEPTALSLSETENTHQPVTRQLQRPNLGISSFAPQEESELCESSLAQRRSAHLPKLRQLSSNLTNLSFEAGSFRNEMGDINFKYADCDTFASELAELYSYAELNEWTANGDSYQQFLQQKKMSTVWIGLAKAEKQAVLADIIQYLEMSSAHDRLEAARTLLYILQGAYLDLESPHSEVVTDCMDEARRNLRSNGDFLENFCLLQAACNAYLAYEAGVFRTLCEVLLLEANDATEERQAYLDQIYGNDRNPSALSTHSNTRSLSSTDGAERPKKTATMAENEMIRAVLSCLYHMVESIRRSEVLAKCTHVSDYSASRLEQLQQQFIRELREPIECIDKPLLSFLFDLVPPFIRGSCTRIPIKKVMLLIWKVMLASCGDMQQMKEEKAKKRQTAGLPPIEDTVTTAAKMRATNFSTASEAAAEPSTRKTRRFGGAENSRGRLNANRGAFNRQQALTALSGDDSSSVAPLPPPLPLDIDDEPLDDEEASSLVLNDSQPQGDLPDGAAAAEEHPIKEEEDDPSTPLAHSPIPSSLPWTSKVRESEIEQFIENERLKFYGYKLPGDGKSLFGFPPPVLQSVNALRRHLYTSTGDLEIERERLLNKFPFSHREQVTESPAENLYVHMVPTLPTDSICFLKVLLAAIPAPKAKMESAIILSDVLSKHSDAADMLSSSLNLDVCSSTHNVLEEAVRLAIDINRHKEIIVKATTAVLINLLKLFRLTHIYQFENLAQQLVLTNCLPLILKFLDQNMAKYFQSKNELAPLCYPKAVVWFATHERQWPILSAENIAEEAHNQSYFLWRNVFSSVNLLRILNKLTKNKHSRTMMLVVFKSAPILKRCLKIRLVTLTELINSFRPFQGIFQFYALKLLKMQARYLGRQWRRTNMDVISSIYMKVRHRLNDDWAFANETRCKSWDFQMEERDLKSAIERFNSRRYGDLYPELTLINDPKDKMSNGSQFAEENENEQSEQEEEQEQEYDDELDLSEFEPVDNSATSLLSETPEFSVHFRRNYEKWLEDAVFRNPVDWDAVIKPTDELEQMNRPSDSTELQWLVGTFADTRELQRWFQRASIDGVRILSVQIDALDRLVEIVEPEIKNMKQVIFVSNSDVLVQFLGLDKTARILHQLSTFCPVITRLFERFDLSEKVARLHYVCSNVLRLRVKNGKTICETKTEKKDGAYGQTVCFLSSFDPTQELQTEEFTIDPTTLCIHAQAYQLPKFQIEETQANGPQDSLPKTTFDMGLNLSAEEQKAKRSTKLPFTHAQNEEGLVSLNIGAGKKIRAGGQIIYTPDQGDDLDDSDPDEDLMI
ncbi:Striatin-interacting protein 2 [Aphelenchoides besseyi]|nr:Striatin-interacting protein 2 [Aphelenchoides besseyi]